jgi:hypothetical protein
MPIPATTANAAISIVSGLVRLTGRIDHIKAEQTALREELALGSKVRRRPPSAFRMVQELKAYLDQTAHMTPDPLNGKRAELSNLLSDQQAEQDRLQQFMEEFLPEKMVFTVDDPSGEFARKLAANRATWDLDDADILQVTYYLGAGEDLREADYRWQLAMVVVDVLADVALANQALIFRDDKVRPILAAVLERFSDADLAEVGAHRVFLRIVLKATLNGALDATDALESDKAWVNSLLSALATARQQSPLGDDFIVGLVRGRGYPQLLGSLLQEGAGFLSDTDAGNFERVAADLLTRTGELVQQRDDFEGFFQHHWGDLLRAGLSSVHANGSAILEDEDPLLREALMAAIQVLSTTDNRDFLSSGTLMASVEAAIGAVVLNPELLAEVDQDWLRQLLESTAGVLADRGIRRTFTAGGLQTLMQTVFADFAERPELLTEHPGLARDVAGSILSALAESGTLRVETIATAGVQAVLNALSSNPDLVGTNYPAIVAEVARSLAVSLEDLRLTREEAGDILADVAKTVAADPTLVGLEQESLAASAFAAVFKEFAEHREGLLTGAGIRGLTGALLEVVSSHPGLLADQPALVGAAIAPMLGELGEVLSQSGPRSDQVFQSIATAGLRGVLASVAADPTLLDSHYSQAVGKVAGALSVRLEEGKLTVGEVEDTLTRAARIVASNPELLVRSENDLAAKVLGAVLGRILDDGVIRIRRHGLVGLLAEALSVVAAHGKGLLGDESADKLATRITVVIDAGLEKSARELGRLVDRDAVPLILASLLRRWALDNVETLDINDPRFERLFAAIAADVIEPGA